MLPSEGCSMLQGTGTSLKTLRAPSATEASMVILVMKQRMLQRQTRSERAPRRVLLLQLVRAAPKAGATVITMERRQGWPSQDHLTAAAAPQTPMQSFSARWTMPTMPQKNFCGYGRVLSLCVSMMRWHGHRPTRPSRAPCLAIVYILQALLHGSLAAVRWG